MKLSKFALSATLMAACGFAAMQVTGQEPAATAPAAKDSRGPLPAQYGRLGLSDETKSELYKIDDEYDEKIESLIEQIKTLQAERDAKMMEILSETERARLLELREEAASKKADAVKQRNAAKKAKKGASAETQDTPPNSTDKK